MNGESVRTFEFKSVEFEKCRKRYETGEFTDYTVYRFPPFGLENSLLKSNGSDVLNSSAQIRGLKLLISGNTLPIIAYRVTNVLPEKISESLPSVTPDGENLVCIRTRMRHAIDSFAAKNGIEVEEGKVKTKDSLLGWLAETGNMAVYKNEFSDPSKGTIGTDNLLPVHEALGFLSDRSHGSVLRFNTLFFSMEPTDMQNRHTFFGQPYGLISNGGKVVLPPLFKRGALFLNDERKSSVKTLSIEDIQLSMGGVRLIKNDNCEIRRRPKNDRTDRSHGIVDIVVVNDDVMSWKGGGDVEIPDSGFVIRVDMKTFSKMKGFDIVYDGIGGTKLAIQGGPVLVKDGVPEKGFGEEEFGGFRKDYPPTVFPFNWEKIPAARTAIGFDGEKIIAVLAEGCNEISYRPGFDSRGFTLSELAEIMAGRGSIDAINLDGGGSTHARFMEGKPLRYADRRGVFHHEFERPIPAAVNFGGVN